MKMGDGIACPPISPRDYYHVIVKNNYDVFKTKFKAWLDSDVNDEGLDGKRQELVCSAMNIVLTAYHLHEWIYFYYYNDNGDNHKIFGKNKLKDYRQCLNEYLYNNSGSRGDKHSDFALLGDVANAFKHLIFSNDNRRISSAADVGIAGTSLGELPFGEGVLGGLPELIITLKGGQKRALGTILYGVMKMWGELDKKGLI